MGCFVGLWWHRLKAWKISEAIHFIIPSSINLLFLKSAVKIHLKTFVACLLSLYCTNALYKLLLMSICTQVTSMQSRKNHTQVFHGKKGPIIYLFLWRNYSTILPPLMPWRRSVLYEVNNWFLKKKYFEILHYFRRWIKCLLDGIISKFTGGKCRQWLKK